jgi:FkbM family methyltransferase
MNWQTTPAILGLRNMARKLGLTRHIANLRSQKSYEQAFDDELFSTLKAGDVVWDVGANVGYYTKRFAEAVGPDGHVVAFEPFPATSERLRANMQGIPNYSLQTLALGGEAGEVTMLQGKDDLGATSRIVTQAENGVAIRIATGDGLLEGGDIQMPTVLKIDTEGYELDVLRGMATLLASPIVRAVFVEVHFGLLTERGQPKAPAMIENLLKKAGFKIRWVDPSHIAAARG